MHSPIQHLVAAMSPRTLARLALAVGCAGCLDSGVTIDDAYVIGGTMDFGHPQVGEVLGPAVSCTGTLSIDSCTVVTAAHCLSGGAYQRVVLDGRTYEVEAIASHPSVTYGSDDSVPYHSRYGFDFAFPVIPSDAAVLRLREPCPELEPMPLATASLAAEDDVTTIGYGLIEMLAELPTRKPLPEDPQRYPDGPDVTSTRAPRDKYRGHNQITSVNAGATWGAFVTEGGSDDYSVATACYGDSGGPAVRIGADGREEMVGIASLGWCIEDFFHLDLEYFKQAFPDAVARYGENFDYRAGVFTSVPSVADWLRNPVVCTSGETHLCPTRGMVRDCTEDGMWTVDCRLDEDLDRDGDYVRDLDDECFEEPGSYPRGCPGPR